MEDEEMRKGFFLALIYILLISVQLFAIIYLWINHAISGVSGVLASIFYLLMSRLCMEQLNVSDYFTWHFVFLISKVVLARMVFGTNYLHVILFVVVSTGFNILGKVIIRMVYNRDPFR